MCGPRVRANFPGGGDASSASFLPPALVAKLHRFNLASVQADAAATASTPAVLPRATMTVGDAAGMGMAPSPSVAWSGCGAFLEEQYVDQMIEELLDSDFSMEISC
jgi:hypothetical protein